MHRTINTDVISASLVKEVGYWGGDRSSFVPEHVAKALKAKFEEQRKAEEG